MENQKFYTPVSELMTTEITRVQVDASLAEAARAMYEKRLSCLLIDSGKETVGILTERDLTRALSVMLDTGEHGTVEEIMTSPLITIPAQSDYNVAIKLLKQSRCRRLVVTRPDDTVCGLITRSDLLSAQRQVLEKQVQQRTAELQRTNDRLAALSVTDPMLGIGNRRAMDQALDQAFSQMRRYSRPYSIALMDIDHFKSFNDHYGHQIGDEALMAVAASVKEHIRNTDSIFRYGGEEFLILLPETSLKGALVAADHVREVVEKLRIVHEKSPKDVVTTSLGVSTVSIGDIDQNKAISRADEALYVAKEKGRNAVATIDDDFDRIEVAQK
jgi:diguanylate cyclase (GGDEF)-like protein